MPNRLRWSSYRITTTALALSAVPPPFPLVPSSGAALLRRPHDTAAVVACPKFGMMGVGCVTRIQVRTCIHTVRAIRHPRSACDGASVVARCPCGSVGVNLDFPRPVVPRQHSPLGGVRSILGRNHRGVSRDKDLQGVPSMIMGSQPSHNRGESRDGVSQELLVNWLSPVRANLESERCSKPQFRGPARGSSALREAREGRCSSAPGRVQL